MKITKENLETYLKGSLFFGTGGGLPYALHKEIFDNILKNSKGIKATSLNEFNDEDVLVSAYGVGDPSDIPDNFGEKVGEGFSKFQKLAGIKIDGIIPGEIGAEGLAFQIGQAVDLPVVDSDLVGGRAAPEIQLDVFTVFNLNIAPVLLFAMNGKSLFLEGDFDANEIEGISRKFFDDNGSSGILIGYGISAKEYKKYGIKDTLSYAMKMGELLKQENLDKLEAVMSVSVVYEGKVKDVSLDSEEGFLVGKIQLENGVVNVKNENITFKKKNGKLLQAPDILMFVDGEYNPIHNTEIKKYVDKNVQLIHMPSQKYWDIKSNRKLWKSIKL